MQLKNHILPKIIPKLSLHLILLIQENVNLKCKLFEISLGFFVDLPRKYVI